MKKWNISAAIVVILLFSVNTSHAILVDITDSSLPHFGDFFNQLPNDPNEKKSARHIKRGQLAKEIV